MVGGDHHLTTDTSKGHSFQIFGTGNVCPIFFCFQVLIKVIPKSISSMAVSKNCPQNNPKPIKFDGLFDTVFPS